MPFGLVTPTRTPSSTVRRSSRAGPAGPWMSDAFMSRRCRNALDAQEHQIRGARQLHRDEQARRALHERADAQRHRDDQQVRADDIAQRRRHRRAPPCARAPGRSRTARSAPGSRSPAATSPRTPDTGRSTPWAAPIPSKTSEDHPTDNGPRSRVLGSRHGTASARLLRDRRGGTALRARGRAAAHRPVRREPADPPARTGAGHRPVRPFAPAACGSPAPASGCSPRRGPCSPPPNGPGPPSPAAPCCASAPAPGLAHTWTGCSTPTRSSHRGPASSWCPRRRGADGPGARRRLTRRSAGRARRPGTGGRPARRARVAGAADGGAPGPAPARRRTGRRVVADLAGLPLGLTERRNHPALGGPRRRRLPRRGASPPRAGRAPARSRTRSPPSAPGRAPCGPSCTPPTRASCTAPASRSYRSGHPGSP